MLDPSPYLWSYVSHSTSQFTVQVFVILDPLHITDNFQANNDINTPLPQCSPYIK